jgi:hypothetical protein
LRNGPQRAAFDSYRKGENIMAIRYKAEPGQVFENICITGVLGLDEKTGKYTFFIIPTDDAGDHCSEPVKLPASDKIVNRILTDKRNLGFPLFRNKYEGFVINPDRE